MCMCMPSLVYLYKFLLHFMPKHVVFTEWQQIFDEATKKWSHKELLMLSAKSTKENASHFIATPHLNYLGYSLHESI